MGIEADKYGHCVSCHRCLMKEQVIDGKVQRRFEPDYKETEYFLNDGSRMRVAICKKCLGIISENDSKSIMDSVKKGWEIETQTLVDDPKYPHWTKEKRKEYLDRYNKLEIICNTMGKPEELLKRKLEEHKRNK